MVFGPENTVKVSSLSSLLPENAGKIRADVAVHVISGPAPQVQDKTELRGAT